MSYALAVFIDHRGTDPGISIFEPDSTIVSQIAAPGMLIWAEADDALSAAGWRRRADWADLGDGTGLTEVEKI